MGFPTLHIACDYLERNLYVVKSFAAEIFLKKAVQSVAFDKTLNRKSKIEQMENILRLAEFLGDLQDLRA
jgi:hypothetical protein